jgi:hypothetical protein
MYRRLRRALPGDVSHAEMVVIAPRIGVFTTISAFHTRAAAPAPVMGGADGGTLGARVRYVRGGRRYSKCPGSGTR